MKKTKVDSTKNTKANACTINGMGPNPRQNAPRTSIPRWRLEMALHGLVQALEMLPPGKALDGVETRLNECFEIVENLLARSRTSKGKRPHGSAGKSKTKKPEAGE